MRQPGKNNRQRGRGRRNGHNNGQINRNTTIDSNGPDVRLRGNAQQLHEKYIALANDSSAAGERIQAEAYFQFADHYFRVNAAIIAASEERQNRHQEQNGKAASDDKNTDAKNTADQSSDDQSSDEKSSDKPTPVEVVGEQDANDTESFQNDHAADAPTDRTKSADQTEDEPVGLTG